MLQQIALGGTMIALPIYLQMVLEYNALQAGLSHRAAVAEHVRRRAARRASAPGTRRPAAIIRLGFAAPRRPGCSLLLPIVPRADSGWWLASR